MMGSLVIRYVFSSGTLVPLFDDEELSRKG